ncbi:hypothetical protein PQO03_17070 [Lentisphaera profundi]|uniref:Uncharacterized protein n=1 Tax=Lentisphaera profundi TaxID=1658616 RepID=A0ABY7VWG9_9BACT|nr:hypothetical protein [Lentisphaera profundi]WDE97540.1 hypothetical protein PQO03_17070 [Lentisphaera profundi]
MNKYYIVNDWGKLSLRMCVPGNHPHMIPNPHRYVYPKFKSLDELKSAYEKALTYPVVKLAEQIWM